MTNFLKVCGFGLLLIGGFSAYSNFGIPQIIPEPPPVEEKLELGAMTMDQFIALGSKIYNGKGTCTLCHNAMGRAPMAAYCALWFIDDEVLPDFINEGITEYIFSSTFAPWPAVSLDENLPDFRHDELDVRVEVDQFIPNHFNYPAIIHNFYRLNQFFSHASYHELRDNILFIGVNLDTILPFQFNYLHSLTSLKVSMQYTTTPLPSLH